MTILHRLLGCWAEDLERFIRIVRAVERLAERWDMDGKLDADRVGYVGAAKQGCAAELRRALRGEEV